MAADQLLREGKVAEALAEVRNKVRSEPARPEHRVFLFQLLSVLGQWDKALTQLDILGEMDAATLPMVQTYREALRCEVLRASVFAGERSPMVFGDPEPWVALLIEALRLSAQGQHVHAQGLREQAFEQAPATAGRIDGQPFEWIADADPRIGPVVEAVVNGRYYWIPFGRIARIQVEKPTDLRDMVWAPVHFTWANGGTTVGLVPTRYPGSESDPDARVQLARMTNWTEPSPGVFIGTGQRLLGTDSGEFALLDIRDITLDVPAPAPAPAEA
ncbi:MAG: type VI secretion system accessory protein TagJ [Gammaproteobacteria bacterium]